MTPRCVDPVLAPGGPQRGDRPGRLAGLDVIHGPPRQSRDLRPLAAGSCARWTRGSSSPTRRCGTPGRWRSPSPRPPAARHGADRPQRPRRTPARRDPAPPPGGHREMARVGIAGHPLTATAALVWNGDLPRPLQQILFDTADGVTPPRPRSWRRESGRLADAYRSRVLVSSSLQGGAGPAREGERLTQVRGGELTTGTRPSASYRGERGSSGSPSGRGGKPDGDTGPAAAGADSRVFPGACWPGTTSPRGPGPVSLLASVTTLAQVRTDLQGISHAERNWSD